MVRVVSPEKLDALQEDDPAVRANLRDLRKINATMRNFGWLARQLGQSGAPSMPTVEWAAGDGSLGRYLARSRHRPVAVAYLGVDRWRRPDRWPDGYDWWRGDIREWEDYARFPRIVGNLILHQFHDDELRALGKRIRAASRVLVFSETLRGPIALTAAWLLRFAGAHAITRHDAIVSVRAGFRGGELPILLGLDPARWSWQIETTWLGAYRMVAWRNEEAVS